MKLKYIRTKDSICKTDYHNKEQHYYITTDYVDYKDSEVKIGDTIEELCDEFVIEYRNAYRIQYYLADKDKDLEVINKHIGTIYGAIWADKGLIYVAKMNEEGEMELL